MSTQEKLEEIRSALCDWNRASRMESIDLEENVKKVARLIDSAKREELESLPFAHDTMGFCEHFGKQFRPCAKCVVDKRLAELKQSEESE